MKEAIINQLIKRAKKGDKAVRNYLFNIYRQDVENAYNYSAAGKYPKAFGRSYNANGGDFAKDSGEVFFWFTKAIDKYDENKNMAFRSFIIQEIKYRSLDKVRNESVRENREKNESRFPDSPIQIAVDSDNYDNGRFHEDYCDLIAEQFPEGSRERQYIALYRALGEFEKNPSAAICKAMNVSRQRVNAYKKSILEKLRKKGFGGKDIL